MIQKKNIFNRVSGYGKKKKKKKIYLKNNTKKIQEGTKQLICILKLT